jgi:hypothetical protein
METGGIMIKAMYAETERVPEGAIAWKGDQLSASQSAVQYCSITFVLDAFVEELHCYFAKHQYPMPLHAALSKAKNYLASNVRAPAGAIKITNTLVSKGRYTPEEAKIMCGRSHDGEVSAPSGKHYAPVGNTIMDVSTSSSRPQQRTHAAISSKRPSPQSESPDARDSSIIPHVDRPYGHNYKTPAKHDCRTRHHYGDTARRSQPATEKRQKAGGCPTDYTWEDQQPAWVSTSCWQHQEWQQQEWQQQEWQQHEWQHHASQQSASSRDEWQQQEQHSMAASSSLGVLVSPNLDPTQMLALPQYVPNIAVATAPTQQRGIRDHLWHEAIQGEESTAKIKASFQHTLAMKVMKPQLDAPLPDAADTPQVAQPLAEEKMKAIPDADYGDVPDTAYE